MKTLLKISLPVFALTLLTPMSGFAQATCPDGSAPVSFPGFPGTYCPVTSSVPEIGASASVGGTALLLCGAVMLRRKRKVVNA